MPAKILSLTPPEKICLPEGDPDYFWFPPPAELSPKLPARLIPSAQAASPDARIGKVIDFGSRLPVTGKPKEADLGDALHAILAAEFINPGHARQREAADRILRAFGLQSMIQADDALLMVTQFRSQLDGLFHPKSVLVETPFEITNDAGQRARGFIDLMLETEKGWIIIDHKSFLGGRSCLGRQGAFLQRPAFDVSAGAGRTWVNRLPAPGFTSLRAGAWWRFF